MGEAYIQQWTCFDDASKIDTEYPTLEGPFNITLAHDCTHNSSHPPGYIPSGAERRDEPKDAVLRSPRPEPPGRAVQEPDVRQPYEH